MTPGDWLALAVGFLSAFVSSSVLTLVAEARRQREAHRFAVDLWDRVRRQQKKRP